VVSRALITAAALALGAALAGMAAADPIVNVIPEPAAVSLQPAGASLTLRNGGAIQADDAGAREVATYLAALTQRTRGLTLAVGGPSPAIRLVRDPALAGEAYVLDVGHDGVQVHAGTDAGLFYGAVTLWQLMTPDAAKGPVTLQPVHVADAPRFAWRGLMIDSARHFQSPAEIERLIDLMALHKLNTLQWHLTDDQGWRIEIRKYPRLTQVGAWRTPPAGSPDGAAKYGGFYSQADIRRVVAYAAARHVTIVPEIEMPGHATSALVAYPQLGAGPPPPAAAQTKWGILPYVYSDDDKTIAFLEDVLTEVMQLFPGRYIHVGGDEVQHERWLAAGAASPSNVHADINHKVAAFLQAHGRRMVGWDEILQGGPLPGDAVVTSWHGIEGAMTAAASGHDAVLAPAPIMYFDNWQDADPNGPPGRGFQVSLHDVYAFEAAPANLPPETAMHLLGLQGNLWTEHIRTADNLETMAFPRAAALAEDGWSAPSRKDWASFVHRLPAQQARYAALGVPASQAALSVRISTALVSGQPTVTLARQDVPGEVRYSLDGAAPTARSTLYSDPFPATYGSAVQAALFLDGERLGPVAMRRLEAVTVQRRASQTLKLCNPGLALNLEGVPDAAGQHAYLTNPQDACWIYPAVDLAGVRHVTVSFARLPWNFSLDAGHNTVTLHPPRQPTGELQVRLDGCTTDPVAVVALPPGAPGARSTLVVALPSRNGVHDVCFDFTSNAVDPMPAIDTVAFDAPARP
jgi:hexosaminidase